MPVQIVTDSACDLSPEELDRLGITMVPLHVSVGGKHYKDRVELSPAEFYREMAAASELPRTSQPAPQELADAYREASQRGPVLGIHLSSALSGTYQSATLASQMVDATVTLFDSLAGSLGEGLLVLQAVDMAKVGASVSQIVDALRERRQQLTTLVALDTLENAIRGGRVSRLAGVAASLLHLKPIVHVTREGKVERHGQVRGRKAALEYLLQHMAAAERDWASLRVGVAHADCPADADSLIQQIKERFNPKEIIKTEIGSSIGTYAARGGLLVAF